jgi:hypothetical protein
VIWVTPEQIVFALFAQRYRIPTGLLQRRMNALAMHGIARPRLYRRESGMGDLMDLCALTASIYDVAHEDEPDISDAEALMVVNMALAGEGYAPFANEVDMLWAIAQWREHELTASEKFLTERGMVARRKAN